MIVQVALFGVLVVATWFYLFLGEDATEKVLCIFTFVIDLDLVDNCISFVVSCGTNDFLGTVLELIRKILSGGNVALLELTHFHTVTDHKIVWNTTLVELNIILKIFIFLLIQQILLSSLWNIVSKKRVSLMEFGLILTDSSTIRFLQRN